MVPGWLGYQHAQFGTFSGADSKATFIITARRCLIAGVLIFPVVAPLGTVATMLVADHDIGVTVTPLNATVLVPCVDPNFVPVIAIDVPTVPLVGDRELIVGVVSAFTVTVNDREALNSPSLTVTVIVAVPD